MPTVKEAIRAIESVEPEALEDMLKSGLDINAHDAGGDGLLSHALRVYLLKYESFRPSPSQEPAARCLKQLEILLVHGADVNEPIYRGNTALHLAISLSQQPDKPLFELLVGHGSDLTIRNMRGHTPLDLASNRQYLDILTEAARIKSGHPAVPPQKPLIP